nr:uncharacterized protein LOC109748869 [Aegilops tauschii subsp. strangulata]
MAGSEEVMGTIPPAEPASSGKRSKEDGAPTGVADADLEAMMAELGLKEGDLQDVVVEEEELPEESTRWMALARVHTKKTYSQYWFFKNMRVAWDLAKEVKIRPLEDNLYTLQFLCLGDWERVMQDGPWTFKGKAVVITPYDGFTKPSLIDLTKIEIWMQIHDLPDGFYPKIKALSATVGEFIYAEPKSQDFEGNFARVRVRIDVTKPLKNAVSLVIKKKEGMQRVIFRVKFERLPDWCAVCGYLGHLFKECGDGVWPQNALVFKDLKASWFKGPGQGPGKSRGNRSGRGRGRSSGGRGRGATQYNSMELGDNMEEEDHERDVMMEDADQNRKRGALVQPIHKPQLPPTPVTTNKAPMLPPPKVPVSPSSKQESKRTKPSSSANETSTPKSSAPTKNPDARLAGPQVGSRQAQ